MSHLIPVRDGESFDEAAVETYLRQNLNGLPDGTLQVQQFSAGHSNLTYLLTIGHWQAVLRRPPVGPVAPRAHDMHREFKLLTAVYPYVEAAPVPYLMCSDESLIGVPFYVMKKLSGVVLDGTWPQAYANTHKNKQAVSKALITTLAQMHQISLENYPNLVDIGHPQGYMQRQVTGWMKRHELAITDDRIPGMQEVGTWLLRNLPNSGRAALIHNDFKLNNVLYNKDNPGHIVGIVDWEMATVGDPLSDLAITLSYWAQKGDPSALTNKFSRLTAEDGFMRRSDLIQLYSKEMDWEIDNLSFYMAFAYFKASGILQQIYYRWWQGQTQDHRFAALGEIAKDLMEMAVNATKGRYL
ncbi:phosphotransferase family protein [Alicyclobacillus sp. SO9]|uniref:phosphotransferase family protein n=1 Tax=Alicyclobacillus sp. SO9 TaxID=2665646 RepID=UPI0018E6E663|nr:phosphotransferase family protein [Alicyclobacillus sp. SO9]QQE77567.1 phosphotransferase family protein [Alicyclobacillus sp. SO9]